MAETRRDKRTDESLKGGSTGGQGTRQAGRTDIQKTPATEHELQRSAEGPSRDLLHRHDFDLMRDPFSMMHAFRREMDRLFDDFGFGGGLFRAPRLFGDLERPFREPGGGTAWTPQVELFERDGKLHVSADLPGLTKDEVKIELMDNTLTIEGERRSEQRDEQGHWTERSYGSFFRSIPLPEGIDADTANASFENGVLDITFDAPKRQQNRGRQIRISEGSAR